MSKSGVVLVHGAWHDHHAWDSVVPLLEAAGITTRAIDLPGAGQNARVPESYGSRPLDPAVFSTELSPNAGVTQEERTAATVAAIRDVNRQTGGKAVLLGHSLGGLTVSSVAEAIPDELSAAVYLCAFLTPPGMVAGDMIGHPTMANSMVPGLFLADPEQVGALRIDPKSEDSTYKAQAREAFYGDLTDAQVEVAMSHLHPDEPAQVVGMPSPITQSKFGTVARHYIECLDDKAIPIEGQRAMVALTDEAMGNETIVHTMTTSHSPFHSAPADLAQTIKAISGN